MSRIRRALPVLMIAFLGLVSACTPHEVEVFRSLTPNQQQAVLNHYSAKAKAPSDDGDCYSALRYFPGDHAKARRIINRESRNIPTARNASGASGCWQTMLPLHAKVYRAVGCSPAQWSDPRCNTLVAAHLYRAAGWSPWSL